VASLFREDDYYEKGDQGEEGKEDFPQGSLSEHEGDIEATPSSRQQTLRHRRVPLMTDNQGTRLLKDDLADALLKISESMQGQEKEGKDDLIDVPLRPVESVPIDFFEQTNLLLTDEFPPEILSRRHVVGGIGSLVGTLAIPGVCAVTRVALRGPFHAPKNSDEGNVMIGVTVVALLLPYMGKSMHLFEWLSTCSKCCRPPAGRREQAERELLLPISSKHYGSLGLLGVVVALNATSMVAHMAYIELIHVESTAEKEAIELTALMGLAYGVLDFVSNVTNLTDELIRLFFRNREDPSTNMKQEVLLRRTGVMEEWVQEASEEEIKHRHGITLRSQEIESGMQSWNPSWFIAEKIETVKALKGSNSVSMQNNFISDLEVFGLALPRKRTADAVAKFILYAGSFGRVETLYLASTLILVNAFDIDPDIAHWLSLVSATLVAGGKAFWESHIHHDHARKIFRCAERNTYPDGWGTLIPAMGSAGVSAGLMALTRYTLGLQAFGDRYPDFIRYLFLSTAALLDFSAYFASFGKGALDVVRPLARRFLSETDKMRQDLVGKGTKRLKEILMRAKPSTINKMYEWLRPKGN